MLPRNKRRGPHLGSASGGPAFKRDPESVDTKTMKQFNRQGLPGKILAMAAVAAANSPGIFRNTIFSRAFKSGPPVAHRGGGREISDRRILTSITPPAPKTTLRGN